MHNLFYFRINYAVMNKQKYSYLKQNLFYMFITAKFILFCSKLYGWIGDAISLGQDSFGCKSWDVNIVIVQVSQV